MDTRDLIVSIRQRNLVMEERLRKLDRRESELVSGSLKAIARSEASERNIIESYPCRKPYPTGVRSAPFFCRLTTSAASQSYSGLSPPVPGMS